MKKTKAYLEHIENHIVHRISVGKSGADVYELDNNRVAKHVLREKLKEDSLWESYKKEALFYGGYSHEMYSFLPEIYVTICNDDEILLVMKKYRPIMQQEIEEELLYKIMDVLVKVHILAVPDFLRKSMEAADSQPTFFDEITLADCLHGWQSVLGEHPDTFEHGPLQELSEQINLLNRSFYNTEVHFTHGDFHCENLMMDEEANVIVCDWQSCSVGSVSGDISFFMSRLSADGCSIDAQRVMEIYCESAEKVGIKIELQTLENQMHLANLNTSFRFWHLYLHGCSEKSVRDIYEKMVEDTHFLINRL